jgi:hypothetical protein
MLLDFVARQVNDIAVNHPVFEPKIRLLCEPFLDRATLAAVPIQQGLEPACSISIITYVNLHSPGMSQ